jgi:Xaa-Pro aminopeptidase
VVPELEAPRVELVGDTFTLAPWGETADPVREVAALIGPSTRRVAIGDQTWARFVLALQEALPAAAFVDGRLVMAPLRARKDATEVESLRAAARAVDAVVHEMRDRPFGGRRELDVHRELVDRMLERGHQRANFAIVGSGPNGASPHHDASDRVIARGDLVVCDFGGAMHGYCSDITRMFAVDAVTAEAAEAYEVLHAAQADAVAAARVGTPCEDVDAAARSVIDGAGYGERFIHRTGHGIGLDAHEDPYIVAGNRAVLAAGHAFSVEPGIYFPGRWGMRLEDIVVASAEGPDVLNTAPRDLAIVA